MYKNLIIVGGGFAGMRTARELEHTLPPDWTLTVISHENFITFNPLLPEVVGASLLPGHVVAPHRQMIHCSHVCMARVIEIATPHVPHNWESGLWFDETTSTLLAGDLLTHTGQCPALTESDCIAPALEAEELFHATGLTTNLAPTLEQLAQLTPTTLALMHGASFTGDGAAQLRGLADGYAAMAG